MKLMKTVDAVGHVLCHDMTQIIPGEYKDARFRKGHVVTPEDIPVLLSMGKENLYVWECRPGMLHENDAAARLCRLCENDGMTRSVVKEGKIELTAARDGLFRVNRTALLAINSIDEIMMAYQTKQIHLHSRIAIPARALNKTSFTSEQMNKYLLTTVGKVIFNNMFPEDFPYLNEVSEANFHATPDKFFLEMGKDIREAIANLPVTAAFKKKDLGKIIGEIFKRYSTEKTSQILDEIKDMGFKYSTVAGITVSLADIEIAPNKEKHVNEGKEKAEELKRLQRKGLLTMQEWERHLNKLWADVKDDIADELLSSLPRKNPINMMARSGARGNTSNFTQLAGMRGLMAKPSQSKSAKGEYVPSIIEVPIYSCFQDRGVWLPDETSGRCGAGCHHQGRRLRNR